MKYQQNRSGNGQREMRWMCVPVASMLLTLASHAAVTQPDDDDDIVAQSFPQVDTRFKKLKKRVKQLESQVAELQALNLPATVDVNCTTGQTIMTALAPHAAATGQLTINVAGTCIEQVTIARSNVRLVGVDASATIQAPSLATFGVIVTDGANHVTIDSLRLVGGSSAATVVKNAHAVFTRVSVQQANIALSATDGGSLDVSGSTLTTSNIGAYAVRSGVVAVNDTTIEANGIGVLAFKGGTVLLTSAGSAGPVGVGPVVRQNTTGGVARGGGTIELVDTRIEGNTTGVLADSVSAVYLFNTLNGTGNVITANRGPGLLIRKNSAVVFGDAVNTITANLVGVLCQDNPSYILPPGSPTPGTVSGNTNGDIVGCTP